MSLVSMLNQIVAARTALLEAQTRTEHVHTYAETEPTASVQVKAALTSATKNVTQAL